METIWLQRSTADIPWGFRLQGGRDYGVPLSVQRVTPGSVAASGLGQGDLILKIGTIGATNLSHMEGQELIKRAGNILQLTIKKTPAPMSPQGSYGSQVTAQLHDGPMSPSSRGPQHVQYNSYPATHTALPDGSTRIQIQRSVPAQQSAGPPLPPTPKAYQDTSSPFGFDSGHMPDYTLPYKQPDSGGGAFDGYRQPQQNSYNAGNSMSLPRGVGYGDRGQEPRSLPINYAGQPPSPSSQPQQVKFNPTQAYESRIGSSRQSDPLDEINSVMGGPSAFSPTGPGQPFSRIQVNSNQYPEPNRPTVNSYSSSPYTQQQQPPQPQPASYGRAQQSPISPTSSYNQQPPLQRGYSQEQPRGYGQEPQRGYGQEPQRGYGQEPQRAYGQEPQRAYGQEPQRIYGQETQQPVRGQYNSQPARGPYESAMAPQQSYQPQYQQPSQNNGSYGGQNSYAAPTAYSAPAPAPAPAPARPEAPPSYSQTFPRRQAGQPSNDRSQQGYGGQPALDDGYVSNTVFNTQQKVAPGMGVSDFGFEEAAPGRGSQGSQGYRAPEPQPYRPAPEPMRYEPQPGDGVFEARPPYARGSSFHDSQPVSPGIRSVQPDFSAPGRAPFSPPRDVAPPPPPPPGPGASWTPSRPVAAPSMQSRQQREEQKIPDELLSTVLKNKGSAKPFSYGVDLGELKKKIGPPTAPKSVKKKQASPARGGANDDDDDMHPNKPPAGHIQGDFRRKAEGGPRSEIDTSPINIHMGANPKKQSMSFKVLQWMTDTENAPDDPEPAPTRTRRPQRDPTVHNAEDDEMRFTGLHSKAEIPSRAFKHLQKLPSDAGQNHAEEKGDNEEEERVGSYDETSIRYKGKHIPSPSFRVLQSWAEHDPLETPVQPAEEWDDGLPDTLSPEDATDKRYKGGNIPSKVFKTLQHMVGEDTPETPASGQHNGTAAPARAAKAPSQETATDF